MKEFYNLLSKVTDYPEGDYQDALNEAILSSADPYQETGNHLKELKKYVEDLDLSYLKEVYTRTFDLKGMCCLDLGYTLFGEDYKRGEFLVNIQRLQKEHGIDTGVELPDHLTNIMKLLAVMDEEPKKELIEKIVMPALEKMMDNFHSEINKNNFFSIVLKALDSVFKADFNMDRTIFGGPIC